MNQHIAQGLKVDLSQVIILLCSGMIDTADFMQVIKDPPENEEDLLDFIADDDLDRLRVATSITRTLIADLSPDHINALTRQVIENSDHDEVDHDAEAWSDHILECTDCGGILLKSCTCEG